MGLWLIYLWFLFVKNYFSICDNNQVKPLMYHRYVDDCFILFRNREECNKMFNHFNTLHHSISFTMEGEDNNSLPFLDVFVKRTTSSQFITSIYRKRTFTGQYVNFQSHCSRKRKINLIKTLCHRAISICSPSTLEEEFKNLIRILTNNGYPEQLIKKTITYSITYM